MSAGICGSRRDQQKHRAQIVLVIAPAQTYSSQMRPMLACVLLSNMLA